MIGSTPVYTRRAGVPMRVVFFASGGPGNIEAAYSLQARHPELIHIGLVVADRPSIPSLDVARANGTPTVVGDFASECGHWQAVQSSADDIQCYRCCAEQFHTRVLGEIERVEAWQGAEFDLAVLAYRRIITGPLLARFESRMVNQHPADLARLDGPCGPRRYVGIGGLSRALMSGERRTRTSTIIVGAGVDTGEILCQGPWVERHEDGRPSATEIREHEQRQKKASDWPSLDFTLAAIARGRYGFASARHQDGSRIVCLDGQPLGYAGYQLQGPDR